MQFAPVIQKLTSITLAHQSLPAFKNFLSLNYSSDKNSVLGYSSRFYICFIALTLLIARRYAHECKTKVRRVAQYEADGNS
jgi:hypothetical protein